MSAANTDLFTKVGDPGTATNLAAPGYTIGGANINVGSTADFPTDTGVIFAIDTAAVVNGVEVRVSGSYCVFAATVASGTSLGNLTLLYGTPQNYAAGSLTRVYITTSSLWANRVIQGLLVEHSQDGTHGNITPDSVTSPLGTITNLTVGTLTVSGTGLSGWQPLGQVPNTVTYNGNRCYNMVFNGVDVTSTLSAGMRLRTTRTVAGPTQSTLLNGSTQFYNKTTPNKLTFTDDFVGSAWIKLSSYANATIQSCYNGTSGWTMVVLSTGQLQLAGFNGGGTNTSYVLSAQSVPLNRWVHVAAQLDMSSFTATPTTSYVMIDGVDVPATVVRGGTNPTALVQAGSLEIGSQNGGGLPFPGKLAQVAIFNAKVTEATIRGYMSQGLAGTETSLASAYSFNNSITDLNTTTPNNLTSNNAAVATNADSPFGGQASGIISSTLDYAIVSSAVFSTNTTLVVQVPEGCSIPTSGGVTTVSYSSNEVPFGFPKADSKWNVTAIFKTDQTQNSPVSGTWYNVGSPQLNLPIGNWDLGYTGTFYGTKGATTIMTLYASLSTSNSAESEPLLTSASQVEGASGQMTVCQTFNRSFTVAPVAATPYYIVTKTGTATAASITLFNSFFSPLVITGAYALL